MDYMPLCHIKVKILSVVKKASVSVYFQDEGAFLNQSVLRIIIPYLHYHLSSQTQGSWQNVGTNVALDELRTSSSWQERLEHRSEEFLMRS